MKYVIISDLHSNLEALQGITQDLSKRKLSFNSTKNKFICLGDFIGYGPNPNELLEFTLTHFGDNVLIGNHEEYTSEYIFDDMDPSEALNPSAAKAIELTAQLLTEKNRNLLKDFVSKENYSISIDNLFFSHSSPYSPRSMRYVQSIHSASELFFDYPESKGKIAFVGHSHYPESYTLENGIVKQNFSNDSFNSDLDKSDSALIVVPGAGQPRDNSPKTGYAIYDSQTRQVEIIRLEYDISKTQDKMRAHNFPLRLIDRLAEGR